MTIRLHKTKPSSQAQSPIELTGFHYSHLLGKVVFGHQLQATIVTCGELSLIYSIHLYNKNQTHPDGKVVTKIDRVCELAKALPLPPHGGYCLVDSWFTCPRVIDAYAAAGYHFIGALKTNRILYPQGIRTSVQDFAKHIREEDVRLVTVNGSSYWIYRYEGALNGIANAVVLLCWPKQAFGEPKALRPFVVRISHWKPKRLPRTMPNAGPLKSSFASPKITWVLTPTKFVPRRRLSAYGRFWPGRICIARLVWGNPVLLAKEFTGYESRSSKTDFGMFTTVPKGAFRFRPYASDSMSP